MKYETTDKKLIFMNDICKKNKDFLVLIVTINLHNNYVANYESYKDGNYTAL